MKLLDSSRRGAFGVPSVTLMFGSSTAKKERRVALPVPPCASFLALSGAACYIAPQSTPKPQTSLNPEP